MPVRQGLRCILSTQSADQRLIEAPPEVLLDAQAARHVADGASLWVDSSRRFQTLLGFGGAFTEAAAVTWQQLGPAQRATVLHACFDERQGHGYRLCRVHMNSCDFALGNYAHLEQADDHALSTFDITRDRQALLPFIQAARAVAGDTLQLLVSPWSPPAWMKTNGQMNGGGRLRDDCRATWAQCFVRFIQAYQDEGVPVWGVTVQNEPMASQRWDSCLYTAEQERDFIRDFLAPALTAAGLAHVRIVAWDHNRDAMVERASVLYADPAVAAALWGIGFHWYVEDHFEHVQQVHDAWPDKQLLFTEGCQEGGPHPGDWAVAERYARAILQDLNHWTVGWIDWNLLLDRQGGPNHVGNYCSAPILADPGSDALEWQPAYAAIGHFARYIRPGAQRVLCAATREVLETTAFRNPDGSIAVVVLNRSAHHQAFRLAIDGHLTQVALPPRALATFLSAASPG